MKPLIPNKSSKIVFFLLLAFLLVGVYLIYASNETHSGTLVVIASLVMMVFLFVMNQFQRPGR